MVIRLVIGLGGAFCDQFPARNVWNLTRLPRLQARGIDQFARQIEIAIMVHARLGNDEAGMAGTDDDDFRC